MKIKTHTLAVLFCIYLTGCYTQLYTRGYVERAVYPPGLSDRTVDSLARASDSAARLNDSLQTKTVIVNNYYEDRPYYRGYSIWDWDYPIFSFGFYSSRYRSYYDPYWWNGSGHHHRHGGHNYYRGHSSSHGSSGGGHNSADGSGAYHSDKRIFTPAPDYPAPQKGRRSEEPAASPAPKSGSDESSKTNDSPRSRGSSQEPSHPKLEKGKRR